MRVSIVATALDGQVASTNGVVNMVNRIQNRNSGYSDGLFSTSRTTVPNNSYNASVGATALKLEDRFEPIVEPQHSLDTEQQTTVQNEANEESFSENNNQHVAEENMFEVESIEQVTTDNETPLTLEEEYTPKLFSEETSLDENNSTTSTEEQKLFDQEKNQEYDFEIPAFLRRQKF